MGVSRTNKILQAPQKGRCNPFQASLFFLRFFVSSVQAGLDSKLQRAPS
jgi:hypothetical protein